MKMLDSKELCNFKRLLTLFLAAAAVLFNLAYFRAVDYLRQHDPRKSGNAVGTIVYASPVKITVGQRFGRDAIVAHLQRVGFQPSDKEGEPGTYVTSRRTLSVFSRLPEFQNLVIEFDPRNARITGIRSTDGLVQEAQLEPEALGSWILTENGGAKAVRRYLLSQQELDNSVLRDAVLASEDKRFCCHNGLDYSGLLQSLWQRRGGSTITMQVARNVVLQETEPTLARKLKEVFVAQAMEGGRYTKSDIFQAYANSIYMGSSRGDSMELRGFAAASEELFGRPVGELSLGEAATLAGIINAPQGYIRQARQGQYGRIRERRDRVLDLMARNMSDHYSLEKIAQAKAEEITFLFTSDADSFQPLDQLTKHFQQYTAERVRALGLSREEEEAGLHIYTTLDVGLQRSAQNSISNTLDNLPQAAGVRLQAALVAMDRTGRVLCMVGGRGPGEFNRATNMRRSPGSSLKPFIYALALARGQHRGQPFNAATIIDPQADSVDDYRPIRHAGKAARVRTLLARSDNGGATVALHDAGLDAGRELLGRLFGVTPEKSGMIAIGGTPLNGTNPLALAIAYSIFMTNGLRVQPSPFSAVYLSGTRLPLPTQSPERVLPEAPTYVTTQMMRSVIGAGLDGEEGTARVAFSSYRLSFLRQAELAAKTGTSEIGDMWFTAVTPTMVVTAWVGVDDSTPLNIDEGWAGGMVAAPIVANFLRDVSILRPDLLSGQFTRPYGVSQRPLAPDRGCLRLNGEPTEFFVDGKEPRPCPK